MFVLELSTEYGRIIWNEVTLKDVVMKLEKFSLTLQRAFTKISLPVRQVVFVLSIKLWYAEFILRELKQQQTSVISLGEIFPGWFCHKRKNTCEFTNCVKIKKAKAIQTITLFA